MMDAALHLLRTLSLRLEKLCLSGSKGGDLCGLEMGKAMCLSLCRFTAVISGSTLFCFALVDDLWV